MPVKFNYSFQKAAKSVPKHAAEVLNTIAGIISSDIGSGG